MRSLVLITQEQFGYNTDFFYYAKYLNNKYHITYICWDHGLQRILLDKINVVYVKREQMVLIRSVLFLKAVIQNTDKKSLIIIKYFKFISCLIKAVLPFNKCVLDIRTGSVDEKKTVRFFYDTLLKIEAFFFKNITIISERLAQKLNLLNCCVIVPLGADQISKKPKKYYELNLIYVGTLYNRNIEKTVIGLSKFYREFSSIIPIKYTIIGGSPQNLDLNLLKKTIADEKLEGVVHLAGIVPHDKLPSYFDTHNIGISFIPMTDFYDCQPPTKTFEYLMSGMPVIATATSENREIVHDTKNNGVLINDNSDSFYDGLKEIYERRDSFSSYLICDSVKMFTWERIISNLDLYLKKI